MEYRSPDTPVGLVKSAYRDNQNIIMTTLADMLNHDIGMLTTVVIGNSSTFYYDNKMITPRGYQRKYTLSEEKQSLKPHQRLKKEAEPWAMDQETGEASIAYASNPTVEIEPKGMLIKQVPKKTSLQMATEALVLVKGKIEIPVTSPKLVQQKIESIFELAVSPGVANKFFTAEQMHTLAEVIGENGTMEYTPDHQIILKIPTTEPQTITERLRAVDFLLSPIGDVLSLKACDFCYGEKADSIPYAEELQATLGGMDLPKTLHIGFNGCGMACYRAVFDDIGIVFRKGKFDLFIGAKPVGRTGHAAQPVAEGIEPEALVPLVTEIIKVYKVNALSKPTLI